MGLLLLLNHRHCFATLLVVPATIVVLEKIRFFIVLTDRAVGMLIPALQQAARRCKQPIQSVYNL